jgi:hypothetical protein
VDGLGSFPDQLSELDEAEPGAKEQHSRRAADHCEMRVLRIGVRLELFRHDALWVFDRRHDQILEEPLRGPLP